MQSNKSAIMVDVDDTISDTQRLFLREIERQFKTRYNYDDLTPDFRTGGALEYEAYIQRLLKQPSTMAATEPYKGARQALESLHQAGFQVHIVSSRKEVLHGITADWLKRYGFNQYVTKIHPRPGDVNGSRFKLMVAKSIKAKVAFDDTLDVVVELAQAGVEGYLIDKPWNRVEQPLPAKVIRANSFVAAVELFLLNQKQTA
jgi:uncharacterized HAD superfamily protein